MIPRSCSNCLFWQRKRPDATWGECLIQTNNLRVPSEPRLAKTWSNANFQPGLVIGLDTRDIFYCAMFKEKPPQATPAYKPQYQQDPDFDPPQRSKV